MIKMVNKIMKLNVLSLSNSYECRLKKIQMVNIFMKSDVLSLSIAFDLH